MFINRIRKEINLKIVYYGPPLSGKTTNLEYIYHTIPLNRRGEMVSLKTRGDRTLFFDYMQMELPSMQGLTPKFNLYTVPGQVAYTATRKLVLQGVDGVIFVADSQASRMQNNLHSLIDLYWNLQAAGTTPSQLSLIVQFNKRDLNDAVSISSIRQSLRLTDYSLPCYTAIASQGDGVFDTLKASISAVVRRIQSAPDTTRR